MKKDYRIGEPTPPPKPTVNKKLAWLFILVVVFWSAWYLGEEYKDKWITEGEFIESYRDTNCPKPTGKFLEPGFHFVTKFPFVVSVPATKNCTLVDEGWYYDKECYDPIYIPPGHVGVVFGCKGVRTEPLTPGIYRMDQRNYTVQLVPTEKQTHKFGE